MKKATNGFTIVELLIVIVVIAVLATIGVVAYNGVQERARAAQMVSALKQIEKAFRLLAVEQGQATWWLDTAFTGTGNPTIESITSATDLKNYLSTLVLPDGISLRYDNEGDIYDGCSLSNTGVALFVSAGTMARSLAQRIDNDIDDGNLACGKVVVLSSSGNGEFKYYLSYDQSM